MMKLTKVLFFFGLMNMVVIPVVGESFLCQFRTIRKRSASILAPGACPITHAGGQASSTFFCPGGCGDGSDSGESGGSGGVDVGQQQSSSTQQQSSPTQQQSSPTQQQSSPTQQQSFPTQHQSSTTQQQVYQIPQQSYPTSPYYSNQDENSFNNYDSYGSQIFDINPTHDFSSQVLDSYSSPSSYSYSDNSYSSNSQSLGGSSNDFGEILGGFVSSLTNVGRQNQPIRRYGCQEYWKCRNNKGQCCNRIRSGRRLICPTDCNTRRRNGSNNIVGDLLSLFG